MNRRSILVGSVGVMSCGKSETQIGSDDQRSDTRILPPPRQTGGVPLEEGLSKRRSIREYKDSPLSTIDVAQLLWAAQGVTSEDRRRTAPSAVGLYPLETYLIACNVVGLAAGVYKYRLEEQRLSLIAGGCRGRDVARAALNQDFTQRGGVLLNRAGHPVTSCRRRVSWPALFRRLTIETRGGESQPRLPCKNCLLRVVSAHQAFRCNNWAYGSRTGSSFAGVPELWRSLGAPPPSRWDPSPRILEISQPVQVVRANAKQQA